MSPTHDLRTNRDLYLFVTGLAPQAGERSLEDYLKALWRLGAARHDGGGGGDALPLPVFAGLLEAALHEPPPPFDPRWPAQYEIAEDALSGFARWEATIRAQVVDLHEMEQAGDLANEYRYYGLDAPRGARWYNFDPRAYLECAAAGSFGGWQEGDEGGRAYVPGPCAVVGADGSLTTADPRELDEPIAPLPPLSWEDFADFLRCGQWYE